MRARTKQALKTCAFCLGLPAIVFAIIIAAQYAVFYPLKWLGVDFRQPIWNAAFMAIYYVVALAVIILVPRAFYKKLRTNREELGLLGVPTWTDIGLAPIAYVVAFLLGLAAAAFFSQFAWFNAAEAQDVGFGYLTSASDRLIAFVVLAIVAPIAEEVIFRGWLYGKLRSKVNMAIAMLIVSLLFGLVHGQWNVGVNVFMLSLVLCGLREITGTVYAGILVHILKNAIACYLLFVLNIGL
jgi:hypothetical protein